MTSKKAPSKGQPKKRRITGTDLHEVPDTSLILAIDLKRQSQVVTEQMTADFEAGQRYFPYSVVTRLLVGMEPVSFISSFEMKVDAASAFPQITVRFLEKATEDDLAALAPEIKAQAMAQIERVRQFPFVLVESPLIPTS